VSQMTLRRFGFMHAGAVAVAVALAACSSSGPASPAVNMDAATDAGPVCPNDLPASCPSMVPSYKTDIAPILATYCVTCHSPTGVAGYPEVTYADVSKQASSILDTVYQCTMPPIGSSQLTVQQRVTLMDWLVCNAPDN